MNSFTLHRVDYFALGFGLIATALAAFTVGPLMAASIAAGCGLAVGNFLILREVARRIVTVSASDDPELMQKAKGTWIALLGFKFVIMLALIWFVVVVAGVSSLGFAAGFISVPVAFLAETAVSRTGFGPPTSTVASKES